MKSVSVFYPRVTADLAKIIADKNVNGGLDVTVSINDTSDVNDTSETYLPVYVEDYRDQWPKPLVGRAKVDMDDLATITIEVYSPDFVKKLQSGDVDHFTIKTNDVVDY